MYINMKLTCEFLLKNSELCYECTHRFEHEHRGECELECTKLGRHTKCITIRELKLRKINKLTEK